MTLGLTEDVVNTDGESLELLALGLIDGAVGGAVVGCGVGCGVGAGVGDAVGAVEGAVGLIEGAVVRVVCDPRSSDNLVTNSSLDVSKGDSPPVAIVASIVISNWPLGENTVGWGVTLGDKVGALLSLGAKLGLTVGLEVGELEL